MILKGLKYFIVMVGILLLTIFMVPFIVLIEVFYITIDIISAIIGMPYKLFLLLSKLLSERFYLKAKSFENQYCNWLDSFHEKSELLDDKEEFEKEIGGDE